MTPDFVLFPGDARNIVYALVFMVLVAYVARLKDKSRASRVMLGLLVYLLVGMAWTVWQNLGFNSEWKDFDRYAEIVGLTYISLVPWAMLAAVYFSYQLGEIRFHRESRWVIGALAPAALLGSTMVTDLVPQAASMVGAIIVAIGGLLTCLVVVIRKWRIAGRPDGTRALNRTAYLAYAVFFALPLLILPLALLFRRQGALDVAIFAEDFLQLGFWILLGLLFLQYAPEPSSLGAKFVSASCVVVLLLTHLTVTPVDRPRDRLGHYSPAPAPQTVVFHPADTGGYLATGSQPVFHQVEGDTLAISDSLAVPVRLPFPMTVYGTTYDSMYVFEDGLISFGPREDSARGFDWTDLYRLERPVVAPMNLDLSLENGGAILLSTGADSVMVTWSGIPDADANLGPAAGRRMSAQLILRASGDIVSSIGSMPFRPTAWRRGLSPGRSAIDSLGIDVEAIAGGTGFGNLQAEVLPIVGGPGQPIVREERNLPMYRAWATALSLRLVANSVIALLLILILIPLFFRSSVLSRLGALMAGLDRVNRGDLDVRLTIPIRDEVGQLSSRFNVMTEALSVARDELQAHARELESRVEERTADLSRALDTLKSTQTQLIEQEKLASLGSLTAGIAHEIKNPLNFVNNFAEVNAELATEARDALASGDLAAARQALADLEENATQIAKHGKRADSIVRAMMQHARGGTSERETIVVNDFLEEYAALAWHGMRARDDRFKAELVRDFAPDAGSLAVMPQELGRVVLNLLNNAFDAVRDTPGARVTLASRRTEAGVEISVADNGPGIKPEIREKIFEPFFTTKATGEGTGLGLSLSHDIVTKAHAGTLEVGRSDEGGALFTIRLPRSSAG